jgi:hypothetical protein
MAAATAAAILALRGGAAAAPTPLALWPLRSPEARVLAARLPVLATLVDEFEEAAAGAASLRVGEQWVFCASGRKLLAAVAGPPGDAQCDAAWLGCCAARLLAAARAALSDDALQTLQETAARMAHCEAAADTPRAQTEADERETKRDYVSSALSLPPELRARAESALACAALPHPTATWRRLPRALAGGRVLEALLLETQTRRVLARCALESDALEAQGGLLAAIVGAAVAAAPACRVRVAAPLRRHALALHTALEGDMRALLLLWCECEPAAASSLSTSTSPLLPPLAAAVPDAADAEEVTRLLQPWLQPLLAGAAPCAPAPRPPPQPRPASSTLAHARASRPRVSQAAAAAAAAAAATTGGEREEAAPAQQDGGEG